MKLKEKFAEKRILFFSVQTFNLEKEIISKLEELGAIVNYYDERPSNNSFVKGIIRIKRNFYQKTINSYYKSILIKTENHVYNYLFVNRGEIVPEVFLQNFKEMHPECKCIFYNWDSFTNHSHPTQIIKYFDRKFTFDPDDAVKFGLNFRPLFYLDSFNSIKEKTSKIKKFDLLFLGTAHSDRYIISNRVKEWCKINNLRSFCYYFIHGRLVYYYKKIFDKSFQLFDYKKLSFKSLTTIEILDLYMVSNVILDINHPGQKGLTMRTFETIGGCKKMITTNKEIKKYSFYNQNNIYVIDRENINLSLDFFNNSYEPIPKDLRERLSIEGWLNCIFFEKESDFWIKGVK